MSSIGYVIRQASPSDARAVAALVGCLLAEVAGEAEDPGAPFDLGDTTARLAQLLEQEQYFVFVARADDDSIAGFVAPCEGCTLSAGGAFGLIPELYVVPEARSRRVGEKLVARAKKFATTRGWQWLEVTAPSLPVGGFALDFYRREGFLLREDHRLFARL